MRSKLFLNAFLMAIVAVLIACGGAKTPESVVENFYNKLGSGDVDGAVKLMSKKVVEMLGEEKLKNALTEQSKQIQEQKGVSKIEFLDKKEKENEVDFSVKITYGDGETKEDKVKLIKEDGDWKIGLNK